MPKSTPAKLKYQKAYNARPENVNKREQNNAARGSIMEQTADFQLTESEHRIVQLFDELQRECFSNSLKHGFYDEQRDVIAILAAMSNPEKKEKLIKAANDAFHAMKRDLMHSELGEQCEAARKAEPSAKLQGFSGEEEEHADLLIRALDYSGKRRFRLGLAIVLKMRYNAGRPHKHGKAF